MSHRETAVPAQTTREAIRQIEEVLPHGDAPGLVRVLVGTTVAGMAEQFQTFEVRGTEYEDLVSDVPAAWAPDKPPGTYRNADLWHFIDLVRAKAKEPKPEPPVMVGGTRA